MHELVGMKVTVFSVKGDVEVTDVGIVESIEAPFLKLQKQNGDVLYFLLYLVRQIKPFDA